jgi:hypothetical protein
MTTLIPQYDLKNGNATPAGAVNRPINQKLGETVSVKDFGAVGDGTTDDTAAIQAAFNYIAANQFPTSGFPQWTYNIAEVFFPQGTYKITSQISVTALVVIRGIGSAYVAGSTIRQATADTNIFTISGSGSEIQGLNFEFSATTGSQFGYAVSYSAGANSNSHKISDCRCGGYYRYGRFISLQQSNDVLITNNTVDVCRGLAIVIGSQALSSPCSDIRIVGNTFFDCDNSIVVYKAKSVAIVGNIFSSMQSTGSAIKLTTDQASITANSILGITITGNSFWRQYASLTFDGSASDVIYSDNVNTECLAVPLVAVGATDYYRFKFHNNYFQLSVAGVPAYPYTYSFANAPFTFDVSKMVDSEVCDNTVDANGINTVIRFFASASLTYVFGSGMVIRNNKIINNTTYAGVYATHVPMSANELVITNNQTFTNYPVNQQVFNFNTTGIALGDSATFYLDYVVVCDKTGVTAGSRVGTVKVSFARLSAATANTKFNVTSIASVGDDTGGSGTDIPAVSFAGTSSTTGSGLLITVTGAISATFTTSVKLKAYGFTSVGTAQIQSA